MYLFVYYPTSQILSYVFNYEYELISYKLFFFCRALYNLCIDIIGNLTGAGNENIDLYGNKTKLTTIELDIGG